MFMTNTSLLHQFANLISYDRLLKIAAASVKGFSSLIITIPYCSPEQLVIMFSISDRLPFEQLLQLWHVSFITGVLH